MRIDRQLQEVESIDRKITTLENSAKEVLQSLEAADVRCHAEFAAQLKSIERFRGETTSIEQLNERLQEGRSKVCEYQSRIGRVRVRIDRHKEMEAQWKQRASSEIFLKAIHLFSKSELIFSVVLRESTSCVGPCVYSRDFVAHGHSQHRC